MKPAEIIRFLSTTCRLDVDVMHIHNHHMEMYVPHTSDDVLCDKIELLERYLVFRITDLWDTERETVACLEFDFPLPQKS